MLVLHGNQRRELFDEIEDHDVVLTSYALLLRDKELLLEHNYRMVVLDEAQAIKNPATKLARTACLLKAEHRIALSGTPMENHLGELWSVFHFLMPGFLGDRETFRRVFRNQIEKEGDTGRQQLLASRVRPFLLRRTKEQVASELPPKQEVLPRDRAQRGPARPLRERAPVDAQARPRRDRAARPRPQQHRDPGGAAQAAPGLLRPAPAQERRRRRGVPSAKFELLDGHAAQHGRGRAAASSCSRSSSRCWS